MIDVILKVGELEGGMAEGSIVSFQPHGTPLSKHMKKVFAVLELGEDQLPIVEKAFSGRGTVARRSRFSLSKLSRALGRPGLERAWRGPDIVEPVCVPQLRISEVLQRGYTVERSRHFDLNAVGSGKYTVGKQANYSDWNTALADISTSVTAELVFTQISNLSYAMAGVTGNIVMSSPSARIIFQSASPLKGNGGAGLLTDNTSGAATGMDVRVQTVVPDNSGAYVEFKDLFFQLSGTPGATFAFIQPQGVTSGLSLFKIHECIFDGMLNWSRGVDTRDDLHDIQIWNCKFTGITSRCIFTQRGPGVDSFIENCTMTNSQVGVYHVNANSVKVNNCVAWNTSSTCFRLVAPNDSAGDNNISDDSTADDFNGSGNIANQSGLAAEFTSLTPASPGFMRLEPSASILPTAGKAPELAENIAGSIGNARPGSDNAYSVGADELGEIFPDEWNIFTRITSNSEQVVGSGAMTMPVLITELAVMITDEFWNSSREDGGDLRLTEDADGLLPLPLEVVVWDKANRKCQLWIKATIDGDSDTDFYLWAGNANASQPEFNDSRDSIGMFYIWEDPTASREGFVYHCSNDPSYRYAYDSSPAMNHAPVNSGALTQIASPWGFGHAFEFDEASAEYLSFGANKYEFTNSAADAYAMMLLQKITSVGGELFYFDQNASASRRFSMKDQGAPQGLAVYGTAPDGGSVQTHFSGISLSDLAPHILGARIDIPSDFIRSWVDGAMSQTTGLSFGAGSFSAGTHVNAEIGREPGGANIQFYGQEIRYWSLDYFAAADTDRFWETHAAMIQDQAAFWACGELHGQYQTGPRTWRFSVPEVGCLGVENTDFWIEYTTSADGSLAAVLHAIWDAGSLDVLEGLAKRVELEDRLKELRHTYETLRGDLVVDEGTSYERLIRGVQLASVSLKEGKSIAALEYDLTFAIGIAGLGMKSIARDIQFSGLDVSAGNFLVEYAAQDRTVFKEVFRAASIRVPGGPSDKAILVTAIVEGISAGTDLGRRQQAEDKIKKWAWEQTGSEAELKIDGVSLGTAHLLSVQPSNMELPDALVYQLAFVSGYGS